MKDQMKFAEDLEGINPCLKSPGFVPEQSSASSYYGQEFPRANRTGQLQTLTGRLNGTLPEGRDVHRHKANNRQNTKIQTDVGSETGFHCRLLSHGKSDSAEACKIAVPLHIRWKGRILARAERPRYQPLVFLTSRLSSFTQPFGACAISAECACHGSANVVESKSSSTATTFGTGSKQRHRSDFSQCRSR